MFKISIVETRELWRLALEGKLIPPCTTEVERAWKTAREQIRARKLIVDLTNQILIGREGESTLPKLLREVRSFAAGMFLPSTW